MTIDRKYHRTVQSVFRSRPPQRDMADSLFRAPIGAHPVIVPWPRSEPRVGSALGYLWDATSRQVKLGSQLNPPFKSARLPYKDASRMVVRHLQGSKQQSTGDWWMYFGEPCKRAQSAWQGSFVGLLEDSYPFGLKKELNGTHSWSPVLRQTSISMFGGLRHHLCGELTRLVWSVMLDNCSGKLNWVWGGGGNPAPFTGLAQTCRVRNTLQHPFCGYWFGRLRV